MKKAILIVCLVASCGAANAERWLQREMTFERNDTTFRTSFTYNIAHQLVLQTTQFDDAGFWENWAYTEQTFDQNRCTSKSSFVWENSEWQKDFRTIFEYNSAGLLTQKSEFKGVENQWIVQNQTLYFYQQNSQNCTEQRYLVFDGEKWQMALQMLQIFENNRPKTVQFNVAENDVWKPYGQLTFEYDDQLSEVVYREMGVDGFENRHKTLYFYTSDGKIKYEKQQIWSQSWWQNLCQMDFFENGTQHTQLLANWNVQFWENCCKTTDFYEHNLLTNRNFYAYKNSMWQHHFSTTINTDEANLERTIATNYEFFGGDPNEKRQDFLPLQENNGFDFCYASEATIRYVSVDETILQHADIHEFISVFPNPSPDGFFYFETSEMSDCSWEIYNLQGVLIKKSTDSQSKIIDLTHCEKGVYVAKITISGRNFLAKLLKI